MIIRQGIVAALFVALALGVSACGSEKKAPAEDRGDLPELVGEKQSAAPSSGEDARKIHAEGEARKAPEKYDGPLERIAASNILIAFVGAEKAAGSVTRSREAAKTLADQVFEKIQAGEDFGTLAASHSDGPEKEHQGRIGVFRTDKMLPQISSAAMSVKEGETAPPVESPFGFHIVKRDPVVEVYLAQVLVAFKGAKGASEKIERSEEEASSRAAEALAEASKPGARFAPVAGTYSDHPSKMVGGVMGPAFKGLLPPELERMAFSLSQGEIGGPLRTPEGFVILKRLEEIHVRHILVAFKGAQRVPRGVTRSQDEAQNRAMEAYDKVQKGETMATLALRYSDCPSRVRNGDLGITARGMMTDKFEDVAFGLKVGEISEVVKTEFGFHIIERLPD